MKIDLYHNIRWSRYKAVVFSALSELCVAENVELSVFQIADTEKQRSSLSAVELSFHKYPHKLMFKGAYGDVPKFELICRLVGQVIFSKSNIILIPGFDQIEHWFMLLAAKISGKRVGTFCDSTLLDRRQSKIKGIFKRLFFYFCDGIFCYGQRAREFLRYYGADDRKIHQRYQAAALPKGYSADLVKAKRLRADVNKTVFLYVGRLSEEKALDVLLAAFKECCSKIGAAELRIAGGGPLRDELMEMSRALGIDNRVVFLGGLGPNELDLEYTNATCFVLPSKSEPWGLVVNEALHYGCPVIVSRNCGCVPELVVEGVTGFSFETGSTTDLADKLILAVTDLAGRQYTVDACMSHISKFSPQTAAMQILIGCRSIAGT